MTGIYKITNPKGKIYIGQSIDIPRRFTEYNKIQCCKDSKKLYYSLTKYSPSSHTFEVLEECDKNDLEIREVFWIREFNSIDEGLNIKNGSKPQWSGKKRPEHSQFLIENGSGLSYTRTQSHRDGVSKMMKAVWAEKKDEIGKKITAGKIGKGTKAIRCTTLDITFKSINEASEALDVSKGQICQIVKGDKDYIKGLTFIYQ